MSAGGAPNYQVLPRSSDPVGDADKEKQEHIRHLQKEVFQLANYYFVFQGLIFTAFYNTPSNLKCEYRWIPFTLSFIAGFLNLCALSTIASKYKKVLDDKDKNVTGTAPPAESIAVKCERYWRSFYVIGCMCVFIGFFVITLIGSWKITCGGKSLNAAAAPPSPVST